MRNCVLLCVLSFFICVFQTKAQVQSPFEITSPPSPVGSGARAMGVGGAFIAVADDGTAASWNPGALIQLETPEAAVVGTYDARSIDEDSVDFYDINYLSMSYPFTILDTNMILSLNYQRLYDFYAGTELDDYVITDYDITAECLLDGATPMGFLYDRVYYVDENTYYGEGEISMDQTGEVGAIGAAFAVQIMPQFSVGIAYNFWRDSWLGLKAGGFRQEYAQEGDNYNRKSVGYLYDTNGDCICHGTPGDCAAGDTPVNPECLDTPVDPALLGIPSNPEITEVQGEGYEYESKQTIKISGENFNIGFLWDVDGRWTVGGVYRSGFKADADRRFEYRWGDTKDSISYAEHLNFPPSYGLGLGCRYSDALTLTFDMTRVDWGEFYYEYEDGEKISPINGLVKKKADINPAYTFRGGAEYLFIKPRFVVPVRAGLYYDEQPARHLPDLFRGVTIGSGFVYKWLVVDLTYFYRAGENVVTSSSVSGDHEELGKEETGDIVQQMVMLSTIIHF